MSAIRIDIRSILVMLALGYATNALLLWAYRSNRVERALRRYMASQVLLACAFASFSFFDAIPGAPWVSAVSPVAGRLFSLLGMMLYLRSVLSILEPTDARFTRVARRYLAVAVPVIIITALIGARMAERMLAFSAVIGAPVIYTAWRYLRFRPRSRLQTLLGAITLVMSLSFLARFDIMISDAGTYTYLTPTPGQILFFLVQYLFMILAGIGIILFFKEKDDRRLYEAATRDPLTGVLNRGSFDDRAARAISLLCREGLPFSLCIFDLDDLKRINDTIGHHAGDAAIGDFARALGSALGNGDLIGRFGGDEFMVLLQTADDSALEALRSRLSGAVVLQDGTVLDYRASGGAIVVDGACPGNARLDELMIACDHALYESKAAGSGRLTVRGPRSG